MNKAALSCGIDFGTSNSTCAILDTDGQAHPVPLEGDKPVLPSVLFFRQNDSVCFGKQAIKSYIDGEDGRLMRGLKSILGTSLMSEKTMVGRKSRSFEEILTIYLSNVKQQAESFAQATIDNVVMGRPVHFHDNNPDADTESENVLKAIAHNIGFKNVRFQYEPIAAAYAHERQLQDEKTALVVDLGGGTSDFTVIKLSPTRATKDDRTDDILATTGVRIGGTNFDKGLSLASFMPYFGLGSHYRSEFEQGKTLDIPSKIYHDLSDWPFIHQAQSDKAIRETKALLRTACEEEKLERLLMLQEEQLGHALLQSVEQTKISLTDHEIYTSDLSDLGFDFSVEVARTEMENAIQTMVDTIRQTMDDCLTQANTSYTDVDLIILTGGSSELPMINTMVRSLFPHAQISKDDKFGSVGKGLAYTAAQK